MIFTAKGILGEYLYISHTLFILYLESNHTLFGKYTLFGNLAVATLFLHRWMNMVQNERAIPK